MAHKPGDILLAQLVQYMVLDYRITIFIGSGEGGVPKLPVMSFSLFSNS